MTSERIRKVTIERMDVMGDKVIRQVIWEVDCADGSIIACQDKEEAEHVAAVEDAVEQ